MKKDEMPSFDSFNDLVDVSEEMAGLMELANEHHLLENPAYMLVISMGVFDVMSSAQMLKNSTQEFNELLRKMLIQENIDIPDSFDRPREFTAIFRPGKKE